MNERETPRKPPRTPPGLGPRGRRIWGETVQNFDLRADESALLLELCRSYDRLDVLEAAVVKAPLLLAGSILGFALHSNIWLVIVARTLQTAGGQVAGPGGHGLPGR